MKTIKMVLICTILATLTACASIAGSNTRTINVTSAPAGAGIYVDNQQYGVTPAAITLPAYIYGGKSIVLKKRGYQDHGMVVNTSFQPIALLDIFLWPTFIVDAVTGNLVKIDPANLNMHGNMQRA